MKHALAVRLWDIVRGITESAWDNIEEEEPDAFDLQMIRDAETDPDCRVFT